MEYKISILLESSELYIERTNQRFQIQPLNCGKSDDEQKEIGSEMEEESANESRPREETPPAVREIFPQNLPLTKSICQTQPVKRLQSNILSEPAKPIIIEENQRKSIKQATFYKGKKKKVRDNQIPHREIQLLQKLWVLNTRWKPIQQRPKPHYKGIKGPFLFTKTHSQRRVAEKNSPTGFKCSVFKYQFTPYLLLPYDVIKEWLTLMEQVT
ncbi:hypothetical protein DVH24_009280 [Malus domestica]|uniref:Uncharacterized protein n=1 Tax=Malus domestica TaxID=3750 RepID=A0A498KPT0_MALDO|nr:hypothetical protein DVH24_009280 [Malus domestica]